MYTTSSSLRIRRLEETLIYAKTYAEKLNITRVTNITALDAIGIPVYASIRPMAQSICVNAGKGVEPLEAKVGAYMESIEFAYAEYNQSDNVKLVKCSIGDFNKSKNQLIDFCPKLVGTNIDNDSIVNCIVVDDVFSDYHELVPAELVLNPLPDNLGSCIFGSNSNGLASGNSVLEASIHGLFEVIERDVLSFQRLKDTSILVNSNSYTGTIKLLSDKIKNAGLDLWLRYIPNNYNLPVFYACIVDPYNRHPWYVNAGYGCHVSPLIAAHRAICEAAQSRLSYIHGARDDLLDFKTIYKLVDAKKIISSASNANRTIDLSKIFNAFRVPENLTECWSFLLSVMKKENMDRIYRFVYTNKGDPLQVVRIIVARAENFSFNTLRIGERLYQQFNNWVYCHHEK